MSNEPIRETLNIDIPEAPNGTICVTFEYSNDEPPSWILPRPKYGIVKITTLDEDSNWIDITELCERYYRKIINTLERIRVSKKEEFWNEANKD